MDITKKIDIFVGTIEEAKVNAKQKAAWMKKYQEELSKRKDHKAGKVDWDTATFLFNSGKTPEEAAQNKHPYK